jgi:hypothetical protein
MSVELAITQAVEDRLQTLDEWTTTNCVGMPSGEPLPQAGDLFCAIHTSGVNAEQSTVSNFLEEIWNFSTTVTMRIKAIPKTKVPTEIYLKHLTGITSYMYRIKILIHGQNSITSKANIILDALAADSGLTGYITAQEIMRPPMFLNRTPKLTYHGESWFGETAGAYHTRTPGS